MKAYDKSKGFPEFVDFDLSGSKKRALATLGNLRTMLSHEEIICRYNVISKRISHIIPNEIFSSENEEESALACIFSKMKEYKMPVDGYKLYLTRIADENQYNPVLQWIKHKPWDGKSRLQEFYDTIESPEKEAKELLIRRWLITAVCMARDDGVDSAGCLVLQGAQDLGKTWWVKSLVPEEIRRDLIRTDASVDPKDKDSVSQIISYWIVELGEIDATFRRSDISALKSFITRDHDTMRRPYGEGDKRYPRRTALIASVNPRIYLQDDTGNRRYWTIPCEKVNSYHKIDMQQLWAEVLTLIDKGESWRMTDEERAHVKRINEDHIQMDPIEEAIIVNYNWESAYSHEMKTCHEIAKDLGINNPNKSQTIAIAKAIRKLHVAYKGTEKRKTSTIYFSVPQKNL